MLLLREGPEMVNNSGGTVVEEMVRYYAERAPEYDLSAGYLSQEGEQQRLPIKTRYQQLFAGQKVLEIACGTGYWTEAIAEHAQSVLATDVNPTMLSIAQTRCARFNHVKFQQADAYSLAGVPGGFTAAFAVWWWSHIPKSRMRAFLTALHGKLVPGAKVLFVDQLRYEVSYLKGMAADRREDAEGNTIERRVLSDGRRFEIVKNFPSEDELIQALQGLGEEVVYVERAEERHWNLTYSALPSWQG